MGNEYSLNANINASFAEEGITGMRDTMVYELFSRENPNRENPFDGWSCDPYDSSYEKGFLMNVSEKPEFDSFFPDHPLTKARDLVRYIIDNN